MSDRRNGSWWKALITTVIVLIIVHIVMLIIGAAYGNNVGWFNLNMVWPHWSGYWLNATLGVIATVIVYFIIYGIFASRENRRIED